MYARGLLAAVVLLIACVGPATADEPFRPPRPPIDQQAGIIDNFYNPSGVPVHLRRGYWNASAPNAGFGWEKIRGKHQISNMGVVRQMVHAPGRIYENPPGSNRWIHEHIARRFRCGFGCVEVEHVTVKLVVDYNDFHGRGPIGIITLYCENPDRSWACPAYVNNALNAT